MSMWGSMVFQLRLVYSSLCIVQVPLNLSLRHIVFRDDNFCLFSYEWLNSCYILSGTGHMAKLKIISLKGNMSNGSKVA